MIRFKKIKANIKKKIPILIKEFKRNTKIEALYLFGSYSESRTKPLSDIDIAVLLKKNFPASKYTDFKISLLCITSRVLETEEIDLVIINEAPFELAFNIFKSGKILFCRNEKIRQEFQEKAIMNYLDTQNLRREGLFHLRERIRKGKFGYD